MPRLHPHRFIPTLTSPRRRVTLTTAAFVIISAFAFGQVETILHDFVGLPNGAIPMASLVSDAAGNLYGTTERGGLHGAGAVFKLSPVAGGKWSETVLYSFTGMADGARPVASLVFDGAGNLYGTTSASGSNCGFCGDGGTAFELSPNSDGSWSETTLHSFGATGDGSVPMAGLIIDGSGNLYGTTYLGGSTDSGIVFELSPSQSGWTETILYNFLDQADGGYPVATLTFDKAGNLYGTGEVGGNVNCNNYQYQPIGCGVVFELVHNSDGTWSESALHSFDMYDGWQPMTGVTFDSAGNLNGTTMFGPGTSCTVGCGTVFQMTPGASGWTLRTVYSFAGGPDGDGPLGNLVLGADGHFYGTTQGGGNTSNCSYGCGTVFELTPTAQVWKEKIIHNFSGSASAPYGVDGSIPAAGVVFDQFGNLYGTTSAGGTVASVSYCPTCGGTVFKMSKNSSGQWATSLLYAFTANRDGLNPTGGLVADAAGNLYGTTQNGGSHGHGSVYALVPQASGAYKEHVIYSFLGGADGQYPIGGLVSDAAGNLYGTTYYGGVNANCSLSYGCGTVFKLTPAGGGRWTETVLHAFANTDGVNVSGPLTMDAAGNLFGAANGNNQGGLSTIFELSPAGGGWNFSVLYAFTAGSSVAGPGAGMLLDAAGNLYGVAGGGVRGGGVVFQLSPGASGWTLSVLHDFHGGADGLTPIGLAFDKSGGLIGVTYQGGNTSCQGGCGTVFSLVNVGGVWKKGNVYEFAGGADAANPWANLTMDAAGNLYGPAVRGGSNCTTTGGCGAVFKLTFSGGAWHESVAYSFWQNSYDVYYPSQLLLSSSNILYGTGQGGDDGNGAAFQIDLNQAPQNSVTPPAQQRYGPRSPQLRSPYGPYAATAQSGKGGN